MGRVNWTSLLVIAFLGLSVYGTLSQALITQETVLMVVNK